jgi:hypothetical protein
MHFGYFRQNTSVQNKLGCKTTALFAAFLRPPNDRLRKLTSSCSIFLPRTRPLHRWLFIANHSSDQAAAPSCVVDTPPPSPGRSLAIGAKLLPCPNDQPVRVRLSFGCDYRLFWFFGHCQSAARVIKALLWLSARVLSLREGVELCWQTAGAPWRGLCARTGLEPHRSKRQWQEF